ncbi:hypothetical protein HYPSUDRAFT_428131 [Hypholoma sublateritium FD-334 SS-4]|uniref:Uncharacterized protein n=1 Tax=Hypholoma sublateritium (strain FD-334 SS-4) TaxID=945553 RepID=A0A0D2LV04_HYPSF|nr:hypothetical protein HYPSUDRAFT_428131 [Hypholoma sublateritium FD-334 SS-4]
MKVFIFWEIFLVSLFSTSVIGFTTPFSLTSTATANVVSASCIVIVTGQASIVVGPALPTFETTSSSTTTEKASSSITVSSTTSSQTTTATGSDTTSRPESTTTIQTTFSHPSLSATTITARTSIRVSLSASSVVSTTRTTSAQISYTTLSIPTISSTVSSSLQVRQVPLTSPTFPPSKNTSPLPTLAFPPTESITGTVISTSPGAVTTVFPPAFAGVVSKLPFCSALDQVTGVITNSAMSAPTGTDFTIIPTTISPTSQSKGFSANFSGLGSVIIGVIAGLTIGSF